MGTSDRTVPKAVRHKRILDIAADRPDATMDEIASEVPSATGDLVEHVLEEYGDPAEEADPTSSGDDQGEISADMSSEIDIPGSSSEEDEAGSPVDNKSPVTEDADGEKSTETVSDDSRGEHPITDVETLTAAQRETLRAVAEHPEMTQSEIGELLDVSNATVCNRVNAIDGFDWEDREAFVTALFDETNVTSEQTINTMNQNGTAEQVSKNELSDRIDAVEERLDAVDDVDASNVRIADTELAHKVMHACLDSDAISEEEELQIVDSLLK